MTSRELLFAELTPLLSRRRKLQLVLLPAALVGSRDFPGPYRSQADFEKIKAASQQQHRETSAKTLEVEGLKEEAQIRLKISEMQARESELWTELGYEPEPTL